MFMKHTIKNVIQIMTLILMKLKQNMKKKIGKIMKLNTKHKAKIRREVDLELGVKAPRKIVFKSKKIYTRKSKHKNNTN